MAIIVLDPEGTGTVVAWPDPTTDRVDPAQLRSAPGGGEYAFLTTQTGSEDPVTYDPCRRIRVVVNPRLAPDGADAILADALAEMSELTGLQFAVDGTTERPPDEDWQPRREGDGWEPVQISWTDAEEVPELDGPVAGLGGSAWLPHDGHRWFVSGRVMLDAPQLAALAPDQAVAVLLHELGHLVGLDHVDDDTELMHPSSSRSQWGPGDLAGLSALGRGRCA